MPTKKIEDFIIVPLVFDGFCIGSPTLSHIRHGGSPIFPSGHRSADPLLFTLEALHLTRLLAGCDLLSTERLTCHSWWNGMPKIWMRYDMVYI
jgi:hypothetical protein